MNKLLGFLILQIFFLPIRSAAQFGGTEIISPEIHEDNTVTFRVMAPNAEEVKVSGDWLPFEGWVPGSVAMVKDDQGLWSHTTEPLPPELYGYAFLIDGFRTLDPNNAFAIRDVATLTNIFLIDEGHADLYSVNDVPHGTVTKRWYNSPSLGMDRRITIYTPPGYEGNNEKYPVLYLLHGAGGDEGAWMALGRASQIMDNLLAKGQAKPMIVVMPNGNVIQDGAPGEGSRGFYKPQFMIPGTMDGQFEASFPDIVKFVESEYRVKADKSNRAIAGLSMGGFHSLHISRYFPDTYDYIGLFSAAILPSQNPGAEIYVSLDETLERQKENGYELYWIGIGKTDFLYKNVLDYKSKLDKMDMPFTYRESEGGHIWRNWRVYLSEFVPLLFNESRLPSLKLR